MIERISNEINNMIRVPLIHPGCELVFAVIAFPLTCTFRKSFIPKVWIQKRISSHPVDRMAAVGMIAGNA